MNKLCSCVLMWSFVANVVLVSFYYQGCILIQVFPSGFHPVCEESGAFCFANTSVMNKSNECAQHWLYPSHYKLVLVFSEQTRLRPALRLELLLFSAGSTMSERQRRLRCKYVIVYRHSDKTHTCFSPNYIY